MSDARLFGSRSTRRLRFAALALALLLDTTALAQSRPTLPVLIGDLTTDALPCDITRRSLESAAEAALQKQGVMPAAPRRPGPFLYVRADAMLAPRGKEPPLHCAVSFTVQVRTNETRSSYGGFRAPAATVLLCAENWIIFLPISRMSSYLSDAVAQGVRNCLGKLSY